MNVEALIGSLNSSQLIRAKQSAISFCSLLESRKGSIAKVLTVPQLLSTLFIDSPSVTSIIAPKVFELIEKGYVSAETVLENVLRLSFKTLSPFSIEHITMVAVLCVFALGKDSRSPPPPTLHPLSELISACPNAWKPLVTKALPALTQRGASECFVIRWLWPYFRTVFLKEVNLVMFRSKLYDFVVDFSKTTGSNILIEKIISLVPLYNINTNNDDYTFAVQAVKSITDIADTLGDDAKIHLADSIMSVMCSTHHQQKQRPPYDPFASALCSLAKADPTLLGVKRGSAPAAIGMLLSASSADETNALLSAVEASAEHSEKWCPYAAAVLRGALVEVQCSSESKIAGRAAALLGKIKCVGGCACRETSDSKYPKNPLLITVETMHRELCQTWSKEDAKEVHSWLFEQDFGVNEGNCDDNGSITSEEEEEKESANNSNCADGDPLFTLFFRPFLMHPAVSVREEAMEVAVRRRGTDVLPLLTAVLHMLQEEEENSTRTRTAAPGELTLKAISTIAHFARCKAAVTPVLSALVPLTKRPALFPTALRALELVWELQPRTAPVLFSRLQQYRPEMSGDMRLAIALTVRDVALEDPAAAASDLVHVILAIVRSDPSSVCVGLALEALCYVGDVIDFASIDTFVRTRGLLEKSAPRVVAAAVRLLGSAAARKALAGSQLPSGEAMELPEEDAAVVRAVVAKLAPLREHSDGLVRAAVFDVLGQFPTEFTMEFLEFGIATAICADSCAAARDAGLSLLAKLGAAESSFRGAVASTPSSSSTASRPKTSPKKVGGSDAKARKALEALPGVVAGEWAEDSRTGSSRSALYGALLWAGQGGAGEASQGEGLWDAVDEALEAFECGRGWESRILALSALSTFARKASPALITDSDAAGRLLSTLEDRATESPARGEVCALLAGVFAAALPLTARPHAATFAQAARRWLSEESPEAQFLCGCRVAVACCEGVLLGGSDFATAASALVEEYSGLVIDEDGDEWDRGGAAIGLALISFFVAEAASHRSGSEGVAALLPAYNSLHTLLVDEYDEVEWWRWLGAVALSSVALALLALGDAAPAQTLFSESLTAAKECSGGVCSNAWHSVSCIVLSRTCAGLYNAKKIDGEKRSEALRAMLKAVTAMDNNNNYTDSDVDDTVKGGWLIALAALANFAAGGKSNSSSSSSTTTNGTSAVDDTLTLLKDLVVDADSLPSQAFCLDVFVACANVLGAGVIAGGGSTGPWPLADGALTNNFTRCKALEEAAPGLVQTFRDSFEGDEVGVSKAATWAIGALCRPLPQAPVEDSDSGTGSNSSSSNNKPVHSAVTDAAPSSSAFAGMPVAKLVYETLVDGAGREDFATVATALDYLSSTQRLPNIKWDKLLNAIYESFNNEEVKKRCFGFVQSRMELANKGVGSLARDVAMSCLPLYSTWLQPAKFTSLSKTLQSAGVAALSPMAEFSYADFHNCVMPLLLLETNADATKTSVLPALLTVLREHTQMKCDVPDKIISEYEAALLSAYNTLPSPLTVSGPKVSVDTHLLASLRAVAGALFHIYERKGTLNTAIQTLLAQPLVKGSCTAPSKTIFTTCTLVRDRFVPMKALGACRKWCGDIDRRNASLHVTAIACAAEVAATVRARDGGTDKALWIENAFDTLLAGAPGSLALPTMLEGALSLAPFHVLCRRPHTKRLTVAASAGRCSDCLLNGYLPLELAKAVAASTKGGKADKIVGKIASLAVHCSAEKSVLEVPMARMLLDAIISNNNPAHPVDSQLLKWL